MKGHTYLFTPGKWSAFGAYWDEAGTEAAARGETTISHADDFWFLQGVVDVAAGPPVSFAHQYEITPFMDNFPSTVWVTHNESIGKMGGVFTVVQESILSNFNSEDNQYSGFEVFVRIDKNTYRNEGVFFKGRRRLSSWATLLSWAE